MLSRSCDQLCPIRADRMALMISVTPAVPPVSSHQCHINATCVSAHLSCLSVSPISASLYRLSVPSNSASQCRLSVPYECCLSVPISDACQ
ncbi:unnamed protein product [Staurois parvus]|uniref:Uncharacterized protein n=1 Tax=Staurois parvus TaxID=386267 RepID=A0ABN9FW91_9NEOB|nr:unnamed protein product [Staurois parvus]